MAAPEGNQFWKLRSSHGRDTLFASADLLWDAATEYFEWCDNNPWYQVDYKGKDADRVEIPTARPYTLNGLCLYLNTSRQWWGQFVKNEKNKDFFDITSRIEQIIYTQKLEGATVGTFNANIVSRELGLVERKETVTTKTKKRPDWLTPTSSDDAAES